jgi:NAD(P)-dependent dehydrogenase (short-subunit alcohol dehydrogenase family)
MIMEHKIVVTGASGNLGTAVCRKLLGDGDAHVVAFVHRESSRASLAEKLGANAEVRVVELASEASVAAGFEGAGPIYGLVNCAGGWKGGSPVAQTAIETFDEMIELNVKSAFVVSREALRRGARRIVNVASFTAAQLAGMSGSAAYNLSKAAVVALTKAIAEEGANAGVRCNCVAPGTLRTKENERGMPSVDPARWVPIEEVADAIAYLLGPEGAAVNGAVLTLPSR